MAEFTELVQRAEKHWDNLTQNRFWVRVGGGTSAQAVNCQEIFSTTKQFVKTEKLDARVSLVGSLGLMYLEPTLDITSPNGERYLYGNVEKDEIASILGQHIRDGKPNLDRAYAFMGPDGTEPPNGVVKLADLPIWNLQTRIATRNSGIIDPLDILQYIANAGYSALHKALIEMTPQDVLEEVKASGLRGRGGAAFSTGLKWSFLANSKKPQPRYVLCNCEEGDPGAFNDKGIIENDPHTNLEGLIINGYATHASHGVVFIRHGHDLPIDNMRHAINQAYEVGILGENIFNSGFSFDVEVALTGDSYVAGEETAMMEAIEGKRAQPRFKPPFPAAVGLWQRPTNINNVKTLSYVPQIVLKGADWFKSIGTEPSSGTALVCLSGHIKQPGLYEVDTKKTIKTLLYDMGGGSSTDNDIKLIQTGGPLGGILGTTAFDVPVCFDEMKQAGAILGSGGIIVGDTTVSVVDLLRNLVAFNQFESCGKCFPCRLGYTHMLEVLERMGKADGRPDDLPLLERIGSSMKVGSLCGHGQLGYEPVLSAMKYFEGEFKQQISDNAVPVGTHANGSMLTPTRTRP